MSRVIVGLTSTPLRINSVDKTIMSIFKQTRVPDEIVITIPKKSARFGTEYNITHPLILRLIELKKITLNVIDNDYGPATKFVGLILKNYNPNDIFIWIDDDIEYSKHTVKSLIEELHYGNIVGLSGFNFSSDGKYHKVIGHMHEAEVLEGFSGVASYCMNMPVLSELNNYFMRYETNESLNKINHIQKAEFLSDDLLICYFFKSKNIKKNVYCKQHCFFGNCVNVLQIGKNNDALHMQPGGNMEKYNLLNMHYKLNNFIYF